MIVRFFRRMFLKRRLLRLLADGRWEFRKLTTLAKKVGLSKDEVVAKLTTIGARAAYRNNELWGLCSRIGNRPRRRSRSY